MSFFVMPYTFTVMGRFKMVQSNVPLSSIAPVHLHLFETALNGPLFWAFDKKRHTYAPSQGLRQNFWRLAKHFMNPKMEIMME